MFRLAYLLGHSVASCAAVLAVYGEVGTAVVYRGLVRKLENAKPHFLSTTMSLLV